MTELKRFQLRLVRNQHTAFNFEQASVAVLARYKVHGPVAASMQIRSEWRDPVAWRHHTVTQPGGVSHG